MQLINTIITAFFDLILSPFSGLSPIWGLLVVSVLTGIVMVIIFKYTSNQSAIRETKDKISAYFMEIRLFKDDLGLMLDAQRRILRTNLRYMKYSVMPMLVMIVPVILILAQLGIRYANRPLRVGESALVKLKLAQDAPDDLPVSVETSDGIRLETPLFRMPGEGAVEFRIGVAEEGEHKLLIHVGDETVRESIIATRQVRRVYPSRTQASFSAALLAPGQEPLPENSALDELQLELPPQTLTVFGIHVNWLVFFFIASIAAGYSLKGVFRVQL
ncbi:MAG: hypothetical protein C4532_02705 [Candidatus Abyssobacteria bacterium SURF_17]|uniref:DUF106 domain-containing protein n=1 Tax=Candidatus Abyssobacteria bacterium SURF_17 TaxID=2093361 RepID=A0A419F7F4_9BACT|nr:MAG: hypothetical protein C4532_02705 [Candidatus Abyssubacteria bacterium SURF_17]